MTSEIVRDLLELGLKLTPQRIEIMKALKDNMDSHPTLNELHGIIQKNMPTISFSTLFNTINTLEKAGYLSIFNFKGETRIELNPDNHINIIDRKSGRIVDIDDGDIVKKVLNDLEREDLKDKKVLINVIISDD